MTKTTPNTYETKTHDGPYDHEATAAFDDFMHAFEDFKDTNDHRLRELENKMTNDVITEEKLKRAIAVH